MITVSFRGVTYNVPEPGDAFSQSLTDFLNALSSGAVPFPTTADVDYGSAFGLKLLYLKTRAANPAASGVVRQAVGDSLAWRNNANNADLALAVNSGDQLSFAGVPFSRSRVTLTYGGVIAVNAALGDQFVVTPTDGVAHTLASPTNGVPGQRFTFRSRNTFGVLGVLTFGAAFKQAGWVQPANGFSRSMVFEFDGTNWIQATPVTPDVPN